MGKNTGYFYLSGLISSLMLAIIVALFMYVMFVNQKTVSYALTKSTTINVSLVTTPQKKQAEKKQSEQKPVEKKSVEEKPVEQKPVEEKPVEKKPIEEKPVEQKPVEEKPVKESKSPEKTSDISSLFSKVSTKPAKEKKDNKAGSNKPVTQTKQSNSATQSKSSSQAKTMSMTERLKQTTFSNANVEVQSEDSSSGEEVNEYLAKIQGQIYNNFFPPQNTQGQSAKVLIRLSADGKVLDFRILSYSGDDIFNAEVDRLKNRVENLVFPENPDHKDGNYIITLVAKE